MTICFIHGLGATENCFKYLSKELGHAAQISYDSSAALADSVAEVSAQIPEGPVTLIGHSLGGVIAVLIAHEKKRDVKKVVTISSPLGGSRAARWLKYFMPTYPIMYDIQPQSPQIRQVKTDPGVPVLSIVSTEGGFPILGEPNDGTVEIKSQRALSYAKQFDVPANHFEVLLRRATVDAIKGFL